MIKIQTPFGSIFGQEKTNGYFDTINQMGTFSLKYKKEDAWPEKKCIYLCYAL